MDKSGCKKIIVHLLGIKEDGSDVIGVYPLLPNGTCRFLVFDLIIMKKEQRLRTFNRERVLAAQDELQMRIARIWGCKTIVGLVDSENPYMEL